MEERTLMGLSGVPCINLEEAPPNRKSKCKFLLYETIVPHDNVLYHARYLW